MIRALGMCGRSGGSKSQSVVGVGIQRDRTHRQITQRRGNIRACTADWMVLTKHRRHTTRCPHGDVSIVARAWKLEKRMRIRELPLVLSLGIRTWMQMTHSSSWDVGGSGSLSSNLFSSLSCNGNNCQSDGQWLLCG